MVVKRKSPTKSHKKIKHISNFEQNEERLLDLIKNISTSRQSMTPSKSNLAARLMTMHTQQPMMKQPMQHQHKNQHSRSFSSSSSFSSVMHNGHVHSQGKQVVNDSTKPYLAVKEMHNGQVNSFMIPKDTIPYNKPSIASMIVSQHMSKPKHTKKTKTTKKSKKSKKTKTTKKTTKRSKKH
jgi:hypothetical protein